MNIYFLAWVIDTFLLIKDVYLNTSSLFSNFPSVPSLHTKFNIFTIFTILLIKKKYFRYSFIVTATGEFIVSLTFRWLRGSQFKPPFMVFPKLYFVERGWSAEFLLTFKAFISYIVPESVIRIHQVIQKIWRFSSSFLTIFVNFLDFFTLTS